MPVQSFRGKVSRLPFPRNHFNRTSLKKKKGASKNNAWESANPSLIFTIRSNHDKSYAMLGFIAWYFLKKSNPTAN
jgi:hypothetical protein